MPKIKESFNKSEAKSAPSVDQVKANIDKALAEKVKKFSINTKGMSQYYTKPKKTW